MGSAISVDFWGFVAKSLGLGMLLHELCFFELVVGDVGGIGLWEQDLRV